MKKILGISLFAMMAVTTANAEIASKAFVEAQDNAIKATIGEVSAANMGTTSSTVVTAINELATKTGTGNVASQIDAKINALDATVSQAAGSGNGQLALSVTETDGVITAVSGSIAAETYDAYGAATTAETNAKGYTDTKVGTLGTHEVDGEQVAYTDVVEFVNDKITTVTGAADSLAGRVTTAENDIDALEAKVGNTAVSTQISNAITAENLSQYQTVANKVTTVDAQSDDNHYPSAAAVYTAVQGANTATTDAIADLDATVSHAAGTDGLALSVTEVDGKLTGVTGSIAANTYDAYGAATTEFNKINDATRAAANAGDGTYALTMKLVGDQVQYVWEPISRN